MGGLNPFHKQYKMFRGCCDQRMRSLCNQVAHGDKNEEIKSQTDLTIKIGHGGIGSKTGSSGKSKPSEQSHDKSSVNVSAVPSDGETEMTVTAETKEPEISPSPVAISPSSEASPQSQ